MTISRDEAAQSLNEIERSQRHSFQAYAYKSAAPFLILWGVLWMVGYGTTEFAPDMTNLAWIGVGVVGTVASTVLGIRTAPPGKRRFDWRIAGTWAASLAFISAIFSVIGHIDGLQVGAIIPLLIAWSYVILGFWMGSRFTIAGLVITAVTLGGYFYWPEHFAGLMAVVGGGALMLSGFWLRRA